MPDAPREILIIGITESGSTFRPSDWAERLCGVMSAFGADNRMQYSPYVHPVTAAGIRCEVTAVLPFAKDTPAAADTGKDVTKAMAGCLNILYFFRNVDEEKLGCLGE